MGIKTITTKESLLSNRQNLEALAFDSLKYEKSPEAGSLDDCLTSDEYKHKIIHQLTSDQLVDIVFT